MRSVIIRRTSPDKQQKQITNVNYIQNFMSIFLKKLNIEVKMASDKIQTKENTCISKAKIWNQSIIRLGNN